MIRKKQALRRKPVIDLTGPDGNAFFLLARAHELAELFSLQWEPIEADMKSGDYDHLIHVFNQYFGEYVDLER